MDQLLIWLWNIFQGYGFEFILIVLSICVLWNIYVRFQHQLESFAECSPMATLLIDNLNGELIQVNPVAKQLLGIRKVGKSYFLPQQVTHKELELLLQKLADASTSQPHLMRWSISQHTQIQLEATGRKIWFAGRWVWFVCLSTHHATEQEKQQEIQVLRTYKSAFDHLSELIFIKDIDGNLVSTNRAFQRFWQARVDEGATDIEGVIEGRASKRRWTIAPDGRSCLLETSQTVLLSSEGNKIGLLGISHDVTDWHNMQCNLREEMEKRKDTEVALAQRDTILQNILESSPDSIGIFDENMVYQACNKPFVTALGLTAIDELIGKRLQDVISSESYSRLSETDNKVLYEGKSLRYIDRVEDIHGQCTWYDVVKSPFRDPASGTNGVLIMARDVSERYLAERRLEEANVELERLSFIDGLTKIPNRRRFDEQLETLWRLHIREQQSITVMLCDIDYFKDFNDRYGHQKGDEALATVADLFAHILPRSGDCVARYGGEEFGFILPHTTVAGAENVAERIHQGITELAIEHQASDVSPFVTISIGLVSMVPQADDSSDIIIALADSALYQAKANGRNQTCVHHTSNN